MDEQNFDKDIRNILENGPPFDPPEQAIMDMKERLDQAYGRSKWWIPWWWWIPLLILPFAGGMIYFIIKFQILNHKLDEITLQLNATQTDTTTQHYTIYHYDTVYTKVIITQGGEQPIKAHNQWMTNNQSWTPVWASSDPFTTAVPSFYTNRNQGGLGSPLLEQIRSGRLKLADFRPEISSPTENKVSAIDTRSWEPLFPLGQPNISFLEGRLFKQVGISPSFNFSVQKIKPIRKPLVEGVQLGFFGGLAPLSEYANAIVWEANLDLIFSRNWRLRTGFQQIGIDFEEKEADHFDEYPVVEPDNPGDELEEIKASYTFARVPVRVMYTFASRKAIQPYIGIGFSGIKAVRPELEYEFVGNSGEYYKTQAFDIPSWSISNMELGVGLEFYLGKGVNASLEGFRFQNFDKDLELINRLSHFGGKVGLHYHF